MIMLLFIFLRRRVCFIYHSEVKSSEPSVGEVVVMLGAGEVR